MAGGLRRSAGRVPVALAQIRAALEAGSAPCSSCGLPLRRPPAPAAWGGAGGGAPAVAAARALHDAARAWPPGAGDAQRAHHQRQQQRGYGFLTDLTTDTSKVYTERRLMGWSPEQMYDVVSRVENYSQFVPWCVGSTVLRARDDGRYIEAELQVGFQAFVERYTSKVTLQRPHTVHSSVADSGLFDHMESTWALSPGPCGGTTWLSFKVDFAFRSSLYRHAASLFFDEVVRRMMDAFEGRCADLYGPSKLAGRRRAGAGAAGAGAAAPRGAAAPGAPASEKQRALLAREHARVARMQAAAKDDTDDDAAEHARVARAAGPQQQRLSGGGYAALEDAPGRR